MKLAWRTTNIEKARQKNDQIMPGYQTNVNLYRVGGKLLNKAAMRKKPCDKPTKPPGREFRGRSNNQDYTIKAFRGRRYEFVICNCIHLLA